MLFNPNTSFYTSYYDKARYLLAWRISMVFFLVFCVVNVFYINRGFTAVFPSLLVVFLAVGCLIYLHKTKNFKPLFWIYALSGTFIPHLALNTVMGLTHYVDFLWMVAGIFLSFVGLGRKVGIMILVLNFILVVFFFVFTLNKHISVLPIRTPLDLIGEIIEVAVAFFIIGFLTYQYIIFQNYSERQLKIANQELEEQNKLITSKNDENIILLKEVHHRVKNNLQIIISLLRLQQQGLPKDAQEKFEEAINRVMTISLIHTKLYQAENISAIHVKPYLQDLIREITSSFAKREHVKVSAKTDYGNINTKTLVPLGLILNELISNSFKHAFSADKQAEIDIEIKKTTENNFELYYSDNGIWKEPSLSNQSFGMELLETLTHQLEGSFIRKNSSYVFSLKNLDI